MPLERSLILGNALVRVSTLNAEKPDLLRKLQEIARTVVAEAKARFPGSGFIPPELIPFFRENGRMETTYIAKVTPFLDTVGVAEDAITEATPEQMVGWLMWQKLATQVLASGQFGWDYTNSSLLRLVQKKNTGLKDFIYNGTKAEGLHADIHVTQMGGLAEGLTRNRSYVFPDPKQLGKEVLTHRAKAGYQPARDLTVLEKFALAHYAYITWFRQEHLFDASMLAFSMAIASRATGIPLQEALAAFPAHAVTEGEKIIPQVLAPLMYNDERTGDSGTASIDRLFAGDISIHTLKDLQGLWILGLRLRA